jgi:uncharacterized membrane protein YtjA (UPF0391 family)
MVQTRKANLMLYTLAVVLLVLWLLGLVTSYTLGGVLHVLLVIAIILFVVGLLQGRRSV